MEPSFCWWGYETSLKLYSRNSGTAVFRRFPGSATWLLIGFCIPASEMAVWLVRACGHVFLLSFCGVRRGFGDGGRGFAVFVVILRFGLWLWRLGLLVHARFCGALVSSAGRCLWCLDPRVVLVGDVKPSECRVVVA